MKNILLTAIFAIMSIGTATAAVATEKPVVETEQPAVETEQPAVVKEQPGTQPADEASENARPNPDEEPAGPPTSEPTPATTAESPNENAVEESEDDQADKDTEPEITAPGMYWTSQGGAVDEPGTRSVDVQAGFPGLTVMFSLPVVRHLEIDPFFSVNYWGSVMDTSPTVSTNVGARLKLNGYSRGSLQIALVADLSFGVSLHPDNGFCMNLSFPQMIISGKVAKNVHVFGGMKIPITLNVHPDFRLAIAFAGSIGAEFIITDKIHLFVMADAGPEIAWVFKTNPVPGDPSTESSIGAWLSTSFGIAARF